MEFEALIKRWGNSMAIIIPSSIVEELNLKGNERVTIKIEIKKD